MSIAQTEAYFNNLALDNREFNSLSMIRRSLSEKACLQVTTKAPLFINDHRLSSKELICLLIKCLLTEVLPTTEETTTAAVNLDESPSTTLRERCGE